MSSTEHRREGGIMEGPSVRQLRETVPVLYYLSRNRHLEHPHLIEVPVSSSHGLLLGDFIERLSAVRGNEMPSLFSWSCKRNYKNGFVWHDLSEDDLIYPTNRNEYILKGSQLSEKISSVSLEDRHQQNPPSILVPAKQQHDSSPESTSSSSLATGKFAMGSLDCSRSNAGQDTKLFKAVKWRMNVTEASTQTNEAAVGKTFSQGVSTEKEDGSQNNGRYVKQEEPVHRVDQSLHSTLQALINADRKPHCHRVASGESDLDHSRGSKSRVSDLLRQFISCGSSFCIQAHPLGIVRSYRSRIFARDSQRFGDSDRLSSKSRCGLMFELDTLCENPSLMEIQLQNKESSSMPESEKHAEDVGLPPSDSRSPSDDDK